MRQWFTSNRPQCFGTIIHAVLQKHPRNDSEALCDTLEVLCGASEVRRISSGVLLRVLQRKWHAELRMLVPAW